MKTTYLLVVLGLLCAVAYSLPIDEDQPLEDEPLRGNMTFYAYALSSNVVSNCKEG